MKRIVTIGLAAVLAFPVSAAPLESSRALVRSLAQRGRAEATLRYVVASAPGSAPRSVRATLALEPPDRARLDVPATGEKITLRGDGGEWLQPSMKQLIKLRTIYDLLEEITDRCEDVANIIEGIVLENS